MRRVVTRACGLTAQAAWRRPPSVLTVRQAHSQWAEGEGTGEASTGLQAAHAASLSAASPLEADAPGFGPVSAMVSLLDGVHTATGLPWCEVAGTVCVPGFCGAAAAAGLFS